MKSLWINWKKVSENIRLRAASVAEVAKASVVFVLNFQSDGIPIVKIAQNENVNLDRTSERNICVKWQNVKIW